MQPLTHDFFRAHTHCYVYSVEDFALAFIHFWVDQKLKTEPVAEADFRYF